MVESGKKKSIAVELEEAAQENKTKETQILQEQYTSLLEKYENLALVVGGSDSEKSIWSSVFQKSISSKKELIDSVNRVKSSFIASGIVDLLVGDAVAPSPTTSNVVDITSDNKVIKKVLTKFQERIDIDSLVTSIIEDLICYGEYYLSVESKKGEGVLRVVDNVDQADVVSVYDGTEPTKFLRINPKSRQNAIEEISTSDMIHFCIGSRKLRIKVNKAAGVEKLDEYVRVGRPLFYGVFDLINTVTLLTSLIPAAYLQKINGTTIVGVSIPEGTDPEKAFKACRRYEQLLNRSTSYDPTKGDITVSDILSAAGKYKCVPVMGDKGRLERTDPRKEESADVDVFQELKKDIFGSLGIPYNFFYNGDISKGDSLKQFGRYVRTLSNIQSAIARGLTQLVAIDLQANGFKLAASHLQIKFANALISVEELDKIEFVSTTTSVLGEIVNVLGDITDRVGGFFDNRMLTLFLNKYLRLINLEGLITIPDKPPEDEEGEEDSQE